MLRYLFQGDFLQAIIYVFSAALTVFLVLPFHELAHAFVAKKLGDRGQEYAGRITFNPFAHVDWIGAGMIMLFGFGWAKPVSVNPFYFKNRKWGMALTALAGPVANLIAATAALVCMNFVVLIATKWWYGVVLEWIYLFFHFIATVNIGLAVFNFIPVPPLDGSKVLGAFLPDRIYYKLAQYEQYLSWLLILLIVTDVLDGPMNFLAGGLYTALNWLASLPFIPFL